MLTICKDEIPKLSGNDLRLLADLDADKYQDHHDISFKANSELVARLDKKDELGIKTQLNEKEDTAQQPEAGLKGNSWIIDNDLFAGKSKYILCICTLCLICLRSFGFL